MATRILFIPTMESKNRVEEKEINFNWFPGYSKSQKQKSIDSLHENARTQLGINRILEISTKSRNTIGVQASAFNLILSPPNEPESSVERFYQGSKVFERSNGPNTDIYNNNDFRFKSDPRLRDFGELQYFEFFKKQWEIHEPFYHWLYLNALIQNPTVCDELTKYEAFTDIEFNHKKAFNCQARSVALFLSIKDQCDVKEILRSKEIFIDFLNGEKISCELTSDSDDKKLSRQPNLL